MPRALGWVNFRFRTSMGNIRLRDIMKFVDWSPSHPLPFPHIFGPMSCASTDPLKIVSMRQGTRTISPRRLYFKVSISY